MKLIAHRLAVDPPSQQGIVLLALVLTPKGCNFGPGGVYIQCRMVVGEGPISVLARDVDPEDWLLCHLQVWETSTPEKAHQMLAGLKGQIDRTVLGKRLENAKEMFCPQCQWEGPLGDCGDHGECPGCLLLGEAREVERQPVLPSLGIAQSGAGEVMNLIKNVCRGGGTLLMEQVIKDGQTPGEAYVPAIPGEPWSVTDARGRATVELRWEDDTQPAGRGSTGLLMSLRGTYDQPSEVVDHAGATVAVTRELPPAEFEHPHDRPARTRTEDMEKRAEKIGISLSDPPPDGATVTADVQGVPEGAEVLDVRVDGKPVPFRHRSAAESGRWLETRLREARPSWDVNVSVMPGETAEGVAVESIVIRMTRPDQMTAGPIAIDRAAVDDMAPGDVEQLCVEAEKGMDAFIDHYDYRCPKRWSEVTEGLEVLFDFHHEADGLPSPVQCRGTVFRSRQGSATLFGSTSSGPLNRGCDDGVEVDVTRLKDFKIRVDQEAE